MTREGLLLQMYGYVMEDMTPLELNDDGAWIPLQHIVNMRSTDDGCEHYMYIDGRHYVYDYLYNPGWREYQQPKQKEHNKRWWW